MQRGRLLQNVDIWTDAARQSDEWIFAARASPAYFLYTRALRASTEKMSAAASWARIGIWTGGAEPDPDHYARVGERTWVLKDERLINSAIGLEIIDAAIDEGGQPIGVIWYVHWLDARLREAAAYRGWQTAALDAALSSCLASHPTRFASSRKLSPDRRHCAQLVLEFDDDGSRGLTLVVTDRKSTPVAAGSVRVDSLLPDLGMWSELVKSVRWIHARRVVVGGTPVEVGGKVLSVDL